MARLIPLLFLIGFAAGEIRISLNSGESQSWTVRNESTTDVIPAKVPGGIYSDLQLSEEFFYRQNDHAFRWVGYENWIYETTFTLSDEVLNKVAINLVFHGIDTVGEIWLNGQLVQTVNNMFVRYVIPIKDIAKASNTLEIRLKSPVLAAKEVADALDYEIPPNCPSGAQQGECHINKLRKMQASFSWDWGPAAPSVGIWKSVEIEAFNTLIARDAVGPVRSEGNLWLVEGICYFESATEDDSDWGSWEYGIGISAPNRTRIAYAKNLQKTFVKPNILIYNYTFELGKPTTSTWWPNGYGDQPIYTLECEFSQLNEDENENEQSIKSINVGLRSVELVQEEVTPGKDGLSFYFKINDVPIYAKGANWIPGHVLPELGYDERMLRRTLQSAKDAHMNMLRVWGGGVYESDLFYNICDELGIMIWQDFMFAVALYPTTEEFLQSVAVEVDQNLKRLISHPSIAIWAGNNENEAVISDNWFNIKNNTELYAQDYLTLYVDTIRPIVEANDDSRWYAISSPSNGLRTVEEGGIADNPYSALWGDNHHYNYDSDPRNTSLYGNTRFASEFGFQAMPSFKSISKVSVPEDWTLDSEFTKFRQHHPSGYPQMIKLIKYFLPLPDDDGSEEFYKTFIYYSQISQAISTKTESEKYRSDRTKLNEKNEGFNMGALYWQLNDVWQAPTWASIEFGGRWKMLHYYALKFFAPVIIFPDLWISGELGVFAISDLLEEVQANYTIAIYSWDSFDPIFVDTQLVTVKNQTNIFVLRTDLNELITDHDCTKTTCFLHFSLSGENFYTDNFFYPSSFADITNLEPATLTVTVTKDEDSDEILVNLETDKIAPFVWLETDVEGIFSDNGFTLIQKSVDLKFHNRGEDVDVEEFKKSLVVRSLLG